MRASLLSVAVLAMAAVVALAAAGGPRRAAEGGPRADDPGARAAEQRAAREEARRATPEARAERVHSRHRYANASSARARTVALAKFPEALGSDVWEGVRLAPGERIRKYLGPTAVQVDTP